MEGLPPLDDSLFVSDKKKKSDDAAVPYNAKVCEQEWFLRASGPDDIDSRVNYHKYRADYYYLRKEYDMALVEFRALGSMKLAPSLRRDSTDGECRCLIKLGKLVEANNVASQMVSGAVSDDHLMHALRTLAEVQHLLSDYDGELVSYQRCVHIAPSSGSLWLSLARAYASLLDQRAGREDSMDEENLRNQRLICLLNARQLLKVLFLAPSFYLDRLESTVVSIDREIDEYGLMPDLRERLIEMASETNFTTTNQEIEQMRICSSSSSSEMKDVAELFGERWFKAYSSLIGVR